MWLALGRMHASFERGLCSYLCYDFFASIFQFLMPKLVLTRNLGDGGAIFGILGGKVREMFVIKQSKGLGRNQTIKIPRIPLSHPMVFKIKTIKIPGKSREIENTVCSMLCSVPCVRRVPSGSYDDSQGLPPLRARRLFRPP